MQYLLINFCMDAFLSYLVVTFSWIVTVANEFQIECFCLTFSIDMGNKLQLFSGRHTVHKGMLTYALTSAHNFLISCSSFLFVVEYIKHPAALDLMCFID